MTTPNSCTIVRLLVVLMLVLSASACNGKSARVETLRVLYLTNPGLFHDYLGQADTIATGLADFANVQIDVSVHELERWKHQDFARGYDALIYNICLADNHDAALIANLRRQTEQLKVPALFIHCALHSFRDTPSWWSLPGLRTYQHEHPHSIVLTAEQPHPVLQGVPSEWTVANDEMYINIERGQALLPLQTTQGEDGERHTVSWLHPLDGVTVFGTTLGHNNQTLKDPHFLRLLGNALLFVTSHLQEDGQPEFGFGPNPEREKAIIDKTSGLLMLTAEQRSCALNAWRARRRQCATHCNSTVTAGQVNVEAAYCLAACVAKDEIFEQLTKAGTELAESCAAVSSQSQQ